MKEISENALVMRITVEPIEEPEPQITEAVDGSTEESS